MSLFGRNNSTGPLEPARSIKLTQDASSGAAVSDANLQAMPANLLKKTQAVGVSLSKKNLTGIRAQVVLVLDHSGSMYEDYESGKVQDLVERFLAFALNVDIDGTVPVIPFDSRVKPTVEVDMSNYSNVVARSIYKRNDMGSTNLADALHEVRELANKTDDPLYVAIVTDGNPNDTASTTALVKDLARYPVFIKFLAVQDVPYLRTLDDLSDRERLLDNVDTKEYRNLAGVSDEQFADDMVDEWDSWTAAAKSAGILT